MPKLEILCATMHQNDFSKLDEMNIHSDVVFANQCDRTAYDEIEFEGHTAKMVSTATRGVGKNRNKALMNASGKYLLCSDQDMIYIDGYEKIVVDAFSRCPKADIIVFNLEYMNRFTPARKESGKFKKVHLWNCMRYGTARVAMRKSAVPACLTKAFMRWSCPTMSK